MKSKLFWSVLGVLVGSLAFAKEESYLPSAKNFRLWNERSDCSVYAAVRSRISRRYRELLKAQTAVRDIAKRRREALVLCGAPAEESRRALQDELLADKCPSEYRAWLDSGENVLINKMEVAAAFRYLQSLAGVIAFNCGSIPEVPDSLPQEPLQSAPSQDSIPPSGSAPSGNSESSNPAEKPD